MLELQTIQHSNYQTFKLSVQTIKQKHVRASNYSTFKLSNKLSNSQTFKQLIKVYTAQLLSKKGLRLRVAEARPASMDQAFQLARASAHTRLWVRQDQRHRREEPMEIDATTSPQGPNAKAPKAKDPEEDLRLIVSQAVANQLKGFQKQLGQIMKRFPAAGPAVAIVRPTQRDIRCYGCGRQGHIRRDCPAQGNGQRPPRHQ